MDRSSRSRIFLLLGATIFCTWFCVSVIGAQEAAADDQPTADKLDTITVGGVAVEIDSETGRLREPTSDEVRQLRAMLQQMFASTRTTDGVVTRPDGAKTLVLDESHSVFSVAHLGGDGRLSTRCVMGAANAEAVFDETKSTPGGEEE
jgi:hypothetical protein